MRKFLTALAFGLLVSAGLNVAPGAAKTMTLPVYGRDRTAVPDKDLTFRPLGAQWTIADVDDDGRDDMLYSGTVFDVPNQINPPNPILTYQNLGDGQFELVELDQLVEGSVPDVRLARRIVAAELNGDGKPDVIVSNTGNDFQPITGEQNLLLLSRPTGALTLATAGFPQFSDVSHGVATGDIDSDGDTDIFFSNLCCGEIGSYFLLNDGAGTFTLDQTLLPAWLRDLGRFTSAEIEDVTQDGHPDLALGFDQFGLGGTEAPGFLLVNDGNGSYSNATPIDFPPGRFGAGQTMILDFLALDVNGNGLLDFLVSEANLNHSGSRVQVLISNGDGSFRDESFRFPDNFPFPFNAVGFGTLWINKLEAIDFNNDGALDIYVQLSCKDRVTIFVNNGSGFFQEIPKDIIPNTASFEELEPPGCDLLDNSVSLFPIVDASGRLDFIGPEFRCLEADPTGSFCAASRVETSVYRPIGSRVVALNFAPGALADTYTVGANRTLTASATEGVLVNDIEPDGEPMTVSLVGQPGNGTVTLNADGSFTYEPDRRFIGTDSFTYKASDGDLDSNVATVTVTVEAIALPWLGLLLLDD